MKKLFATILMFGVALVTWGVNPPGDDNALSIPTDGWNASTGVLTVNHSGIGKDGGKEWEDLLMEAGIIDQNKNNVTPITKLILTGAFDNKGIKEVTKDGLLKKLLGENNDNTFYLDLEGCENAYCEMTGTTTDGTKFTFAPQQGTPLTELVYDHTATVRLEEGTQLSFNPVFINGNNYEIQNVPANMKTDGTEYPAKANFTSQYYSDSKDIKIFYKNGGWVFKVVGWGDNTYDLTIAGTTTTSVYVDVDTNEAVTIDNPDDLVDNNDGTYSYDVYTESVVAQGDAFKFEDNAKSKINGITFPDNEHFTFIPEGLCKSWDKLETVVFPNNIVAIERNSFKDCTALESITWSTGLKYIGLDIDVDKENGIFQGCTALETVDLSGCTKLEVLGRSAFHGTTALTTLSLPRSLKIIGGEAFHGSGLTELNLATCTNLEALRFECFEECPSLATVTFPNSDKLTFFGNDAFKKCSSLTTVDMRTLTGITEFEAYGKETNPDNPSYEQFWACTSLTTVILPPNISEVPGNQALFKDCSSLATVTFTGTAKYENGAFTNPLVIKDAAFSELTSLTEVNFSNNLLRIESSAFNKCDIIDVELQECHELVEIQTAAFKDCVNMINVDLCSHPKTIRSEAFRNVKTIKKVEIHGCPNTCMTECICENRGFELDITHHQTAALNAIEDCALLVFPEDGEVCQDSPYASAWDFFVGDYKAGTLITQENLLCYYRNVPKDGQGDTKKIVNVYDEDGNLVYENGQPKTETIQPFHVECMYQKGNGWHEFINVGFGEVVPKGEFLRTYSRSIGDGPCQLPTEITAYRAVDYKSTKVAWVIDKSGTHYLDPAAVDDPSTTDIDERYVQIPVVDGVYDQTTLDLIETNGYKRYSHLTVGGILYLRPLWAKVARYPAGGEAQYEGYEGDNIAIFDSEAIYSQLQNVPGKHSYVPENTGVVLYSTNITEDAFLMLPGDFGTETVYKEFPHTGNRYEEGRRAGGDGVNTDDDINMLQGSYDTGWTVAPVYPWLFKGHKTETSGGVPEDGKTYKSGHYSYTQPKAYRNFACTKTGESNGKKTYGWKRLQPSILKENRAFAKIPVNRFDNFNEDESQMPDFTIEDEPVNQTSNSLMLIGIFEGEDEGSVVDGIQTIKTDFVKVDDNAWYTIYGVRVAQPTKGVYIHNGQKVVIK